MTKETQRIFNEVMVEWAKKNHTIPNLIDTMPIEVISVKQAHEEVTITYSAWSANKNGQPSHRNYDVKVTGKEDVSFIGLLLEEKHE